MTLCQFRSIANVSTILVMETWRDRFKACWERLNRDGMTQDQLAERLGVSQGTIAHWLKGRRTPKNLVEFEHLAEALGVHPAWLIYGIEPATGIPSDIAATARALGQLPPGQQLAVKTTIEQLLAASKSLR